MTWPVTVTMLDLEDITGDPDPRPALDQRETPGQRARQRSEAEVEGQILADIMSQNSVSFLLHTVRLACVSFGLGENVGVFEDPGFFPWIRPGVGVVVGCPGWQVPVAMWLLTEVGFDLVARTS
jgi:hypothetical protein